MIALEPSQRQHVSPFFSTFRWHYLPLAILEGHMGEVYVDDAHDPHFAVLEVPALKLKIIGGDPQHESAQQYLQALTPVQIFMVACPAWEDALHEQREGKWVSVPRYAFTSHALDRAHLQHLASQLPAGYRLERMTLELVQQLVNENSDFSTDHLVNFASPEDFSERGFGFCVLAENEIVSVATTFAICSAGIEIQINTREAYRGKGLAMVTAAHLILHSLANDLDPNWDAANQTSVGLAEKLGYMPQGTYTMQILT